ncbi:MAG: AsmA family protein [Candidatus Coatesbacteria bacterium]|nr:AsmA family protein [Candidatus Coatesbacteria bacterium]
MADQGKARWSKRIIIAALLVCFLIGVLVVAVSIYLSDARVAKMIEEELGAAIGREVSVGSVDLRLFATTLEVKQIVATDLSKYGSAPMLSIGSAEVRFRILPLLGGRVEIERIDVSSLVFRLVQARDGMLNISDIPAAPEASSEGDGDGSTDLPVILVESIGLKSGEVRYIDHLSNQEVALKDLSFKGQAKSPGGSSLMLSGALGGNSVSVTEADNSIFEWPSWNANLETTIDLDSGKMNIPTLKLGTKGISGKGLLEIDNIYGDDPGIEAKMGLALDLAEAPISSLCDVGNDCAGKVSGDVVVSGTISDIVISFDGDLSGIVLRGTADDSSAFSIGSGTVKQSVRLATEGRVSLDGFISLLDLGAAAKSERLNSIDVTNKMELNGDCVSIEKLILDAPGANLWISGRACADGENGPGALDILGKAQVSLSRFVEPLVAEFSDLGGDLNADFSLKGTTEVPQVHIKCESEKLSMTETASKTRIAIDKFKIVQDTKGTDPASLPFQGSFSCGKISITQPKEKPYSFEDIHIDNRLVLNTRGDLLTIDKFYALIPGVNLDLSGTVDKISTDAPDVAMKGKGELDLARLLALVRPFSGLSSAELDGQGKVSLNFDAQSKGSDNRVEFIAKSKQVAIDYAAEGASDSRTRYTFDGLEVQQSAVDSSSRGLNIEGAVSCSRLTLTPKGQKANSFNNVGVKNDLVLDSARDSLAARKLVVSLPGLDFDLTADVRGLSSETPDVKADGKAKIDLSDLVSLLRPLIGVSRSELDAKGKLDLNLVGRYQKGVGSGEIKLVSDNVELDHRPGGKGAVNTRYTIEGLNLSQRATGSSPDSTPLNGALSCKKLTVKTGTEPPVVVPGASISDRATYRQKDDSLKIDEFAVVMPGVRLNTNGDLKSISAEAPMIDLKGDCSIDLERLMELTRPLIGMSKAELDAEGELKVAFSGRTGHSLDVEAKVSSPRVVLKYQPKEKEKKQAGAKGTTESDLAPLDYGDLAVHASSRIDQFIYNNLVTYDQVLDVNLRNNRLEIKQADFRFAEGSMKTRGWAKLDVPGWEYSVNTQAAGVKVADLGELVPLIRWMQVNGKVDGTADLAGKGTTMDALGKYLNGTTKFKVSDGQLMPGPMLSSVGSILGLEELKKPIKFREMKGQATVKDGKVNVSQLDTSNNDMSLTLTGGIWLDGRLDLDLDATLSEQLSSRMAGLNQIASLRGKKVKIPFKIGGTLSSPRPIPDLKDLLTAAATDEALNLLDGFLKKK